MSIKIFYKKTDKKNLPCLPALMAASPGLEPRLTESESAVLPLDDEAIYPCKFSPYISQKKENVKYFLASDITTKKLIFSNQLIL